MQDSEGGEAPCFSPLLNDAGELLAPEQLILCGTPKKTHGNQPTVVVTWTVGAEERVQSFPALNSHAGELPSDYAARLRTPNLRTIAWRVVLLTSYGCVSVTKPERTDPRVHEELLKLLREMVS